MIVAMIATAFFCATPKVRDNTATKWTSQDQEALLDVQKNGCRLRDANKPCLYIFEKLKDGEYNAYCGPEQRRKDE